MIETDVVVIGKGPAGIQASLYIKRANLDVVVIGKDIGMCEKARTVENYYGFDVITGPELVEKGIAQAKRLGISVVTDEVVSVEYEESGFVIRANNATYVSKALIFASGTHRNVPRIRNINQFEGKGVSYCAVCDAFFYRHKAVAVVGAGSYAANEASELVDVAGKVYVLTNGEELTGDFDERVDIVTDKVTEIKGEQKVSSVVVGDKELPVDGIFVALGTASSTDLAQKMGVEIAQNRIVVDESMSTNIPGLFAAGDCTPGVQQIAKAVGDGCVAGMSAATYVRSLRRKK